MEALEITWGVPPEMYYDRRVVDTQATKSEKHLRSGLIFKYLRRYSEELSETVYSEPSDNLILQRKVRLLRKVDYYYEK
jgi:hypothetical protein